MKACACVQARTPVTRVTVTMPPGVLTAKVKCDQGLVGPERRRQRFSALVADLVLCHITRPPSGPGPPPPALSLAPAALRTQACAPPALPLLHAVLRTQHASPAAPRHAVPPPHVPRRVLTSKVELRQGAVVLAQAAQDGLALRARRPWFVDQCDDHGPKVANRLRL